MGTIFEELFIQIKATTTSLIIAHAACWLSIKLVTWSNLHCYPIFKVHDTKFIMYFVSIGWLIYYMINIYIYIYNFFFVFFVFFNVSYTVEHRIIRLCKLHCCCLYYRDMACSVAGITADANVLTNQLRLIAQRWVVHKPGPVVSSGRCGVCLRVSSVTEVDPLSYFLFQPVLHDWCNKGRGMCYPVCGMVHIKNPCC